MFIFVHYTLVHVYACRMGSFSLGIIIMSIKNVRTYVYWRYYNWRMLSTLCDRFFQEEFPNDCFLISFLTFCDVVGSKKSKLY